MHKERLEDIIRSFSTQIQIIVRAITRGTSTREMRIMTRPGSFFLCFYVTNNFNIIFFVEIFVFLL